MRIVKGFISGRRAASRSAELIPVLDPFTEEQLAVVATSTSDEVSAAVASARAALPDWTRRGAGERARLLTALAAALGERRESMVETVIGDLGAPRKVAENVHLDLPLSVLGSHAEFVDVVEETRELGNSLLVKEPVGVVAAITPWNYPLHQVVAKLAPALLAGCTVVLKPSEVTPLVVDELVDAISDVGFPDGVVNVVWGPGPTVGELLVGDPGVDFVSFTGSTQAGKRVAALSAANAVPAAMELGGKSASLLLPGAELERAVKLTVASCFLNSGQTCNALTRLLVPHELTAAASEIAAESAGRYTTGDPRDPATRLGPLVSRVQQERVQGMIDRAVTEGARVLTGGGRLAGERGFFVPGTVLGDVAPGSHIEQNEVFGPVLSIVGYGDVEEGIRIANGTPYGLAGAVWGPDQPAALEVARRLEAGMVDVNGGRFNPRAPFGGVKSSGYGRELGPLGVEEFLRVKSIQL